MKKALIIGNGMMGGSFGIALTKTGKWNVLYNDVDIKLNTLERYDFTDLRFGANKEFNVDIIINCSGQKIKYQKIECYEVPIVDIASVQYDNCADNLIFCHPLCGSEKSGRENARADLFENQTCIITTEGKSQELIDLASEVFNDIGMNVHYCDTVEEHNRNLAYTSHLLHYLAFNGFANLHPVLERLSHSNKEMWENIFELNKKNIDEALLKFSSIAIQKIGCCICHELKKPNYFQMVYQEFVKDIPEHFHGTALKQLLK